MKKHLSNIINFSLNKSLFLLILFISCNSSKNKFDEYEVKQVFNKDLITYFKAFNNKKWDKMTDLIYPKVFDFTPKSAIKDTYLQLENMGIKFEFNYHEIDHISNIFNENNKSYCRLYYTFDLIVSTPDFSKTEMLKWKDLLKQENNARNVEINMLNNELTVKGGYKSMIAVNYNNTWKYIEYNEKEVKSIYQFIPNHIFDKLSH